MRRTTWRPTAQGTLSDGQVLLFLSVLCAGGGWILWRYINPLTLGLTLAAFVGYAVIYTLILKPRTSQNIVLGGAAGAMPPVIGWAAILGAPRSGMAAFSHHLRLDAAALLGAGSVFCMYAWQLLRNYSDALARKTFRWSIWHLAGIFSALLADHYLL